MKLTTAPIDWKIVLAFAAVYIIWGSTYIAAVFGLQEFPPFMLVALRYGIAGLMLGGWCVLRGNPAPSVRSLKINSIGGTLTLVGGSAMVVWAEQYVPSGLAAIAVASIPVWLLLIDKRQWSVNFSNRIMLLGVASGFIGICFLFASDVSLTSYQKNTEDAQWLGMSALGFSCLSWGFGSIYLKYHPTEEETTSNVATQLVVGSLLSLTLGLSTGELNTFEVAKVSISAWMAMLYLAVFGSLIAYLAYAWLLTKRAPAIVGTYAYVNPVIAVLLGVQFAGEKLNTQQMIALFAILGSVLVVNLSKYFKHQSKLTQS